MADIRKIYHAVPTLNDFHLSNVERRGVMGPVGSGKSTAMCAEIMRRAAEQAPGEDGFRRSRWAVVRNTYRELMDTTLNTWMQWFPEPSFGNFIRGDMRYDINFGDVRAEVLFRALDRPKDLGRLLSLELTGGWINEAREIPFGLVEGLDDRVGRYPAENDGGCTWRGLIMDTNPPDDDHWWYRMAEERRTLDDEPLEGWEFFRQPGGMIEVGGKFKVNPEAENLENLEDNFYKRRTEGRTKAHIRVYYCARYGFMSDGRPVFPEYSDEVHAAQVDLKPDRSSTLYVGIDFGLTPAALFAQKTNTGRWLWIDELVTEEMGAVRFAEELGRKLRNEYSGFRLEIYGDPAGNERSQVDERTPFQILRAAEIMAVPAPTNDPMIRREAVAVPMMRLYDGLPGFMISPKCRMARKGLAGGYAYKRVQVSGSERYHDKPDKNRYSHICDAGQYAMIGAGEGRTVLGWDNDDFEDDYDEAFERGRSAVTGY